MRPIKLTLSAFGPYANKQVLDFRDLGDRNFFLIHGPTGAGKTTILDAMSFALYGVTSGAERDGKQMRSDYADASLLTEVTFDFSLGKEVYRITRRPEQERLKKRGEGTTTERAMAVLRQQTGLTDDGEEGSVIESQWSKVTEKIESLLGFSEDQFRQVVMLPQGQFSRLLMADSRDRQVILETLFQTELYRRIEEALKEASKEIIEKIRDARKRKEFLLGQAAVESVDELIERSKELNSLHTTTLKRIEEFRKDEKKATDKLTEGKKIQEKLMERDEAEAALKTLEDKKSEFETKRMTLKLARKAETLLAKETTLKQRVEETEEAKRKLSKAQTSVEEAVVVKERAEKLLNKEQEKEREREETHKELLRLEDLAKKVNELAGAKKELDSAEKDLSLQAKEHEEVKKALENCRRKIEENQKLKTDAEKTDAQAEGLQIKLQEAERVFKQRTILEGVREKLVAAEEEHENILSRLKKKEEAFSKAKHNLSILEENWFEGQTAILAKKLVPGTPCPVCGSTEHPMPAHSEKKLPDDETLKSTREQVKGLETFLENFRKEENKHHKNLTKLQIEAKNLKENLGSECEADLHKLDARIKEKRETLRTAKEAAKKVESLENEIKGLAKKETLAQKQLAQIEKKLREATSRKDRVYAIVMEKEKGIPEGLRDIKTLEKKKNETNEKATLLKEALDKAQKELNNAKEDFARCESTFKSAKKVFDDAVKRADSQSMEFTRSLKVAGVKDKGDFERAKESIAEIDSFEEEIKSYEGDLNAAKIRNHRATKATKNLAVPRIEALEKVASKVKEDLESTIREETSLFNKSKETDSLLEELRKNSSKLKSHEERYAVTGKISDIASGKNPMGIAFQRFVLAALLDDVLSVASKRLGLMTKGRFYLQRSTERADQRTAGGLDLEVYDTYTGTTRAVSTLSGGEGFLASLSLALGLADVVQTYAGGIYLETIFVDEGFGTLDTEALDLAIRTLIDLQEGGRLVGIISHVAELKERIDARLEVVSDRRGSTSRFIVG